MPTLSIPKNYSDGSAYTESMVDDIRSTLHTFFNTTKIDGDNIQTGGVPTAALADLAVTTAKLASEAVETAKIDDLAVTTAKLNDLAVTTGKLAADAVETAKIDDGAVTEAKIAALAVTTAKLAAANIQTSNSCGNYSHNSTEQDIANLSVAITTNGRPVKIEFIGDGTSNPSMIGSTAVASIGYIRIYRDSTELARYGIRTPASPHLSLYPSSMISYTDGPSAGTYTYKATLTVSGGTIEVQYAKLRVWEH